MIAQAQQYPAKTYLQGMGSWLPPLETAEKRGIFTRGIGSSQSHYALQAGSEKHPNNSIRQESTPMGHELARQGLTPMERFKAECVSEQAFSSARVNPYHNKNTGEGAGGKSR